jgi:hypothetical protein
MIPNSDCYLLMRADPEIIALRGALRYPNPDAESELTARISQNIESRRFEIVEVKEDNTFLKDILTLCSGILVGIGAYAFGKKSGQNDILNRLPEDQSKEIKKDLEKEHQKAIKDAQSYL